jgi:hypothetical protein
MPKQVKKVLFEITCFILNCIRKENIMAKPKKIEELNKYSGCFKYSDKGDISTKYLLNKIDMMQDKINELIKIINKKLQKGT